MSTTEPKFTEDGRIELADRIGRLSTTEAAYLGRKLIALAAAAVSGNPPTPGEPVNDLILEIISWSVHTHSLGKFPVLKLTVSPGLELTFAMNEAGEAELGRALSGHAAQMALILKPAMTRQ